ncbi:hypothetical protein Droror1_Dr00027070, partial [Drosera rotundifolia]
MDSSSSPFVVCEGNSQGLIDLGNPSVCAWVRHWLQDFEADVDGCLALMDFSRGRGAASVLGCCSIR